MEWLTRTTILNELSTRQPGEIWNVFVDTFKPMLVSYALSHRIPRREAEDAAQEVLLEFVRELWAGKYDRNKGRLHDWLFGIARNKMRRYVRNTPREAIVSDYCSDDFSPRDLVDRSSVRNTRDPSGNTELFLACMKYAIEKSNEKTFRAFKLYALAGRPAAEVAEELGMTAAAVHLAKHRFLARMREYAERNIQTV